MDRKRLAAVAGALAVCVAGGALCVWLRTPLPWMIGPLVGMATVQFGGAGLEAPPFAEPLGTHAQLAGLKIATSWSSDGRFLAIQSGSDVVVRDSDGVFHPALATSAYEREGRFAPDGRWLAYRSDESGRDQVYVQSYPPGLGKWQISTDGGAQAMWASNGRELFYKNGNRMMVVDVELGTAFEAGTPLVDAAVGLGAALDYLKRTGMGEIRMHEERLVSYMLERIGEVRGLRILGPSDAKLRTGRTPRLVEGVSMMIAELI